MLWLAWASLAGLTAACTWANKISSQATGAEMDLRRGAELTLPAFRLFPATFSFSLIFNTTPNEPRPELGDWQKSRENTDPKTLVFNNPGESVLIEVTVVETGVSQVFEALPTGGVASSTSRSRGFVPYVDDGNPKSFAWPPRKEDYLKLANRDNTLRFKVIEVGPTLEIQSAQLFVDSPLSFKSSRDGYGWLWWFYFWPVYAFVLGAIAILLIIAQVRGVVGGDKEGGVEA